MNRERRLYLAFIASIAIYGLIYTNPSFLFDAFTNSMPVIVAPFSADTPDVVSRFNLRMVSIDGQVVDALLFEDEGVEEVGSDFVERSRLNEVKTLMNQFGGAYVDDDLVLFEALRSE